MEGKETKRKNVEESTEVKDKKPKTESKMKSYSASKKPELCTDASVYLSAVLGKLQNQMSLFITDQNIYLNI
jgi:hypothetical protein